MRKPLALLLALTAIAHAQQTPTPAAAEWWRLTTALANDSMQGRDTGTEAYERAARYVADQFKADGLKPAGDQGPDGQPTFFQRVPMHQIALDTDRSSIDLLDPSGHVTPLRLLYETTLTPRADLPPTLEAPLAFVGYGVIDTPEQIKLDLRGKIAVFFNSTPANLTPNQRQSLTAARISTLAQAGVVGIITIDNPAAIEPTHWPAAYARSVTLASTQRAPQATPVLGLRISAESAAKLFGGTSANPAKLIADGEKGLPLPPLPLALTLRAKLQFTQKDISSPNIIAILPGAGADDPSTAPALSKEYVALSAHLDGYGFGTPVNGDNLYNGALDDAAYVATLLELAHTVKASPPRRSLLFCIVTGEEKGLLGSIYYTQHLTVPAASIVADLNLDQLRPIFPLKILTMGGITDSTLGDTARTVAAQFHIELRPDRETERNLFRRSDNYSFVRIGVPIASFIFGYNPNTPEERTYRDWYARRYHKPQDDLATPIDWAAAVTFNDFYRTLALTIANNPQRPQWLPTSLYAPKP